jgi:hypothetical protein
MPDVLQPGLVFLDSGPTTRKAEIDHWLAREPGRPFVLVVHDANRDYGLPTDGLKLPAGDGLWLGHRP